MLRAVIPNASIFTYDWNANYFKEAPVQTLLGHADNLLGLLAENRRAERPIIFVASCFGGLLLAEALTRAALKGSPYHQILLSTVGIVFLATPFRGSDAAKQAQWQVVVGGIMGESTSSLLVDDLNNHDKELRRLTRVFAELAGHESVQLPVYCFYETHPTEMLRRLLSPNLAKQVSALFQQKTQMILVTESSACLDTFLRMPLDASHSTMNKFDSPESSNFKLVREAIKQFVSRASSVLNGRKTSSQYWMDPFERNTENLEGGGMSQLTVPVIQDYLSAAQNPTSGSLWIVPFSRNKHFVGRKQELAALREWSASEDSQLNMAVFGLGGVGKTQVALEFAYCTRERSPESSVFWIPATDILAFEQAYLQIGQQLNIPGIDADGADIKQLVKDSLSNNKSVGRWLMIVDNADDMDVMFRQSKTGGISAPALIDYIPSSVNGSVLFTTRNRKVAIKRAASNTILLEMMSQEDAHNLLRASLLQQEILSEVYATEKLLSLLGFLPLAIIQAAAYINENDTTIDQYTNLYDDSELEMMEVLSENFEVEGRYDATKNSIATTWLISFSQIKRTNPVAIEYLSFMACMTNQNIIHSLLLPAPSKKQGLEAIGALKAYSFIKKREDGNNFDMHRLVHLATRNWLRSEGKLQIWTDSAVSRLVELLPAGGHENRSAWTAYLPHARYLLTSIADAEVDLQVVALAEKLGKCLYSNGKYGEAYDVYRRALELRTQTSGLENPDTLRNMFGMAEALSHLGNYKEAESQHRRILELRKKVLGPKHAEIGRSMNYLAQAMYYGGRYAEAEQVHRDALELQIEVLHHEHPNVLTTTGYIGQTLSQQGKYEKAEEIHRNLLKTRLRVQGEEYPGALATMSCLGVAQGNLGNYADAEQTHRRVLKLRIKILGDRHPHTLITKRWLADALVHEGKYDEARNLNREVLGLQMEMFGVKHPNTILTLSNLGDIFFFQGQKGQAEEVYRQVLDLQTEVLGPDHPETLGGLKSLADAIYEQGRQGEASELYEKVFEARVRILGPQHPKTLMTPH